jgi:hypothetical protein
VWQVWRVQDEGAWKHFEVEWEKLVRLGFPDEEPELWHSTCHTDPFKVCKDGFDLSYAKEITEDHNKDVAARSSAYGLGLYFAAHPLYTHCIVPCHANCAGDEYTGYFLIRVRMLLGHVMDYKEQLAEDIIHTPKGYHSWYVEGYRDRLAANFRTGRYGCGGGCGVGVRRVGVTRRLKPVNWAPQFTAPGDDYGVGSPDWVAK